MNLFIEASNAVPVHDAPTIGRKACYGCAPPHVAQRCCPQNVLFGRDLPWHCELLARTLKGAAPQLIISRHETLNRFSNATMIGISYG
jgi:hypothetical protein